MRPTYLAKRLVVHIGIVRQDRKDCLEDLKLDVHRLTGNRGECRQYIAQGTLQRVSYVAFLPCCRCCSYCWNALQRDEPLKGRYGDADGLSYLGLAS